MNKFLTFFTSILTYTTFAQAGLTVSPGKLYFYDNNNQPQTQKVSITNPTNKLLEIGVSINDWNYDKIGSNHIADFNTIEESCSSWIQILPNTFFTIEPNSTRTVEVVLTNPNNTSPNNPVHTSMLFFTQLNPGDSVDEKGASIKVTVRMGVKVYHAKQETEGEIAIVDFRPKKDEKNNKSVELEFTNSGKIWTEGKIIWSIFNYKTGKTTELSEEEFYTLPKDTRVVTKALDPKLTAGQYTISAQILYGKNETIQLAEMDIEI